ncbi:TspO/MBR family protein [Halobacillus massiliensis]|uniref:TspO/MBR family protein n=1 Tax=Halobacillus massiliensis TaxID=1926286 RepID=UPI0009E362B0|nr:TspO/MBR family protein [Halobacillus massiliensis]
MITGFTRPPKLVIALLILNYLFNQLFSYFQFGQKDLLLAFIDSVLVALTALFLSVLLWKISKVSSLLLIPYILWSSFAVYLAFTIYRMNPSETIFL